MGTIPVAGVYRQSHEIASVILAQGGRAAKRVMGAADTAVWSLE
jgi:hypothetical protein